MKLFYSFLILSLSLSLYSQSQIDKSKFNLIFVEDFENNNLDLLLNSGKWKSKTPWGDYLGHAENVKIGCLSGFGCRKDIIHKYTDENIVIEDGLLKLKVKKKDDWEAVDITKENGTKHTYHYLYEGAMLHTNVREIMQDDYSQAKAYNMQPEDFTGWMYGLFEVDLIIPGDKMIYPAFWMISKTGRVPEIDAFELDHSNDKKFDFYSNYYYHNEEGEIDKSPVYYKLEKESVFNEMHTWSILWTPTKIVYYLDGIEIRTQTEYVDFNPTAWRKSCIVLGTGPTFHKGGAYWNKNPKKFDPPSDFVIDEVRVYKPLKDNYNLMLELPATEANKMKNEFLIQVK